MTSLLAKLREGLGAQAERHRNRPFMEATMAAAALVASADGVISFSERHRIDQILESLDSLKIFDPHEAVNRFDDVAASLQEDLEAGRQKALQTIAKIASDPEASRLMVRICYAVSEADGVVSDSELVRIAEICDVLGVTLQDCDL